MKTEPRPVRCRTVTCPIAEAGRLDLMERRRFLRLTALGMTALGLLPAAFAHARTVAVSLESLPELQRVGGSVVVDVGGAKLLLVRLGTDQVVALSAICTHQQNIVGYDEAEGVVRCPEHDSVYGIDGRNISGEAPAPLSKYPTKLLADGRVAIKLD